MKVEVNRNDEMPKAGDLVIDELLDYLEDVSEFTRNEKGNN